MKFRGPTIVDNSGLKVRFICRVERSDGCWIYKGLRQKGVKGPGRLSVFCGKKKMNKSAPHVAFFLEHGRWPKQTNHHCDNDMCVRPDHIYEGTQLQNLRDAVERNRIDNAKKGKRSPGWTVALIRFLYATGLFTQGELARKFKVTPFTIYWHLSGRGWRDISGGVAVAGVRKGQPHPTAFRLTAGELAAELRAIQEAPEPLFSEVA